MLHCSEQGEIRQAGESEQRPAIAAQIELVGATDDKLGRLRAEIVTDDIFERYGLERALFICGTQLAVGEDSQGARPPTTCCSGESNLLPRKIRDAAELDRLPHTKDTPSVAVVLAVRPWMFSMFERLRQPVGGRSLFRAASAIPGALPAMHVHIPIASW